MQKTWQSMIKIICDMYTYLIRNEVYNIKLPHRSLMYYICLFMTANFASDRPLCMLYEGACGRLKSDALQL